MKESKNSTLKHWLSLNQWQKTEPTEQNEYFNRHGAEYSVFIGPDSFSRLQEGVGEYTGPLLNGYLTAYGK